MRAVRVVFDLGPILHTSLMQNALSSVSWDFRGIINQQAGDLLIKCECISLNSPPLPPGGFLALLGALGLSWAFLGASWLSKALLAAPRPFKEPIGSPGVI